MSIRSFLVMATVLGAAGGAAAAGYTWMKGAEERRVAEEKFLRMQQTQIGLATHLETLELPTLRSVVAGREIEKGIWEFRAASVESEEKLSPAFGRALLHCDAAFARAECWTLTELTVDGETRFALRPAEIEAARARRVPAPAQDAEEQVDADERADERADAERLGAAPAAVVDAQGSRPKSNAMSQTGPSTKIQDPQNALVDKIAEEAAQAAATARPEVPGADDAAKAPIQDDGAVGATHATAPTLPGPPEPDQAPSAETSIDADVDPALADAGDESGDPETAALEADAAEPGEGGDAAGSEEKTAEAAEAVSSDDQAAVAEPEAGGDPQTGAEQTHTAAAAPGETPDEAGEPVPPSATDVEADLETGPETGQDAQNATAGAAEPAPTHVVSVSEVNARGAPGKSGEVLAVVQAGQELAQIDQRGRWGRFVLLGGDKNGLEVWIYDRLISETN